jgi:predicted Zn-dependent protease
VKYSRPDGLGWPACGVIAAISSRCNLRLLLAGIALVGSLGPAGCARKQATVTARSETAERLSAQARQASDRGDDRSAEQLLTAAVDRNPGDCETRLELAEMLLAHGSTGLAAAHLQKLIEQNPDDPRAYVGLAETRYAERNLAAADRLVSTALELDQRQVRGLLLRAKIEQARGENELAIEDYHRVLAYEPQHLEATFLIAELLLKQGDARLAAPLLRSVIENTESTDEQRAQSQWLLGNCYSRDGRWSDAARSLAAGISSRRGSARDWYVLADASARSGDVAGAQLAIDEALRLAPTNAQALALRSALDRQVPSAGRSPATVVAGTSPSPDDRYARRENE